jgi:uncharacterized protein
MTLQPLRQFILKLHSRCNIACDYCYVYSHEDQSWRGRPLAMSASVVRQTALRIADHARSHRLATVHVILHGGEPLLLGVARMREAITELRTAIEPISRLDLRIHTNAILLDERFCDLFVQHGVKVGVSLDGDEEANDRHRKFADGRGSHAAVRRALALLRRPAYRQLYAGLLSVIDIDNDPTAVYEALAAEEPPRVDLLLPHSTWDHPPTRLQADTAEYADWLSAVYDRWDADGRPFEIRTFDSISRALRGLPSRTESLGLAPSSLVVVETDGTLEQLDSLKTAFDGAPATGLDVFSATFDEAALHEGIEARRQGLAGLCATCRQCSIVEVCGGGLYPHRYRSDNGFDNPSVYCQDLKAIIMHIQRSEHTAANTSGRPVKRSQHVLTGSVFASLASGYGGSLAVRQLTDGQESLRRALLASVLRAAEGSAPHAEAVSLLADLDESAPGALGTVFAHPYTRVWATRCVEGLQEGKDVSAELDHINSLALAAACHAGVAADLVLTARAGVIHLPTLGAALVPGRRTVPVRTEKGTLIFGGGADAFCVDTLAPAVSADDTRWQPVRVLTAPGYTVRLEDTDPYRDCHTATEVDWQVDQRLSAEAAQRWQESFAGAVALIGEELSVYEDGLRAGLSTLMPIAPRGGVGDSSAAARHAFGAIGAALPATPAALALLLVHEFQHVKLGAILDMFDLFDKSDTAARHYAPWRPDPRPLEGLFQGAYAHIGVTDYWRVRRHSVPGTDAEAQFARWRIHTAEAMEVLLKSGSLTALGTRFVEGMQGTVLPWCDEPVNKAALDSARTASAEHRAAYDAQMSSR